MHLLANHRSFQHMHAFENSVEIQSSLEAALKGAGLTPSPLSVCKNGPEKLELRIENIGKKTLLPIYWTLHPKRAAFADPEKRRAFAGLYLAPKIAEPLAKDLREWGINHADLNGRMFIRRNSLFIDRDPKGTAFKNPESDLKLFTAKASRIPRVLLYRKSKTWTQNELRTITRTSPGFVSRILNALESAGYIRKDAPGSRAGPARYSVSDFDQLLDAWVHADDFRKRVSVYEYSILSNDPDQIASETRDAIGTQDIAFTQWFAAWQRQPHATPSIVSGYVKKDVPQRFELGRRVDAGGNLWLLVPKDEGVFQSTQIVRDFLCASDAQIYLDLAKAGLRGPEAAAELRKSERFAQ